MKAFKNQSEKKGFLVEVLSACPTNWGMTPVNALEWIGERMILYYPLGVYKDRDTDRGCKMIRILISGFGGQGILFAGSFLLAGHCSGTRGDMAALIWA